MGGVGPVACQGFLIGGTHVRVLVGGAVCIQEVSSSEFLGVYGCGMPLGSLTFNVQNCVPVCWRISVECLALELVSSWVELGFSVGLETFE